MGNKKKGGKGIAISGSSIQIVLLICDLREVRAGLFPRMKAINSLLRLSEKASARLKLRNEENYIDCHFSSINST